MSAHTDRREGNLLAETQIQSLRMSSPLEGGPGKLHLLAILYVALSLALSTLGGADPTSGFCLGTLSSSRPMVIVGSILDMVVVSHVVEGMMCEESGRHVSVYITLCCVLQGSSALPPRL
jgi:hypothetical protein